MLRPVPSVSDASVPARAATAVPASAVPASAVTARARDLITSWNAPVRLEPLYGPAGSAVYAGLTADDRTEIREITAAARRAPGRILELAAGAGRLTLPLLALGRQVTAVDSSAGMLALLRDRVPSHWADRLASVHADMTGVVEDSAFGLIVLGATSITLLDPDRRPALYEAVATGAAEGGRFALTVAEEGAPPSAPLLEDPAGPVLTHENRGDRRLVTIVVPRGTDGVATVLTSSVTRVDRDTVVAELRARGFEPVTETPVRGPDGLATGIVLVEVACPRR